MCLSRDVLLKPGVRFFLSVALVLVPTNRRAPPEELVVRTSPPVYGFARRQEAVQQPSLGIEVLERVHRPVLTGVVLAGRVVETHTGKPVADAAVTAGTKTALTDADGAFRIEGLQAGVLVLAVEHVAFGKQSAPLTVDAGTEYRIRVSVAPRPIPVAPLNVTAKSTVQARRRASPTRMDLVAGVELEAARSRGETVGQVVSRFAGLMVSYGRFITPDGPTAGVCVESFTRRTPRLIDAQTPSHTSEGFRPCQPLPTFVDDVYIDDPVAFLHNLGLADIEEVEVVPEIMAGARYGLLAGTGGVLRITTRRR